MSLRGAKRRGNLKVFTRHPGAKHGSRKRQNPHNINPSRRDTDAALPRKRYFTRAQVRISHASAYFTRPKAELNRAALPCFAPGCRFAPLKIAASGAKMRPPRNDIKMVGFNLPFLQSNYLNLSLPGRRPNFAACATAPLTKSFAGAGFAGFRRAPRACFPRRSVPRP